MVFPKIMMTSATLQLSGTCFNLKETLVRFVSFIMAFFGGCSGFFHNTYTNEKNIFLNAAIRWMVMLTLNFCTHFSLNTTPIFIK